MKPLQSAYGDRPGNAAHTGFVPGSGVQSHSACGYYPLTIPTVENYDTGIGRKIVMNGGTGVEHYAAHYRIGDRAGCRDAGRRAENAARQLAGLPLAYSDPFAQPRESEVLEQAE